jgi:hypothetical protein
MRWYRSFLMTDDGKTVTMKDGIAFGAGNSTTSNTLAASGIGQPTYYTSAATTGTTYGYYNKLTGTGAGAEFIAGRNKTVLSAAAGNAHGTHSTLEVTSTGYVTGMGTASRANIVFGTDTVVPQGTYYGLLAEIYPIGNTGALPAGSNACLGINAAAGTASDLTANAISFGGTSGSGKMIYTHSITVGATAVSSIRVLYNGVVGYMYIYSAQ